MRIRAGSVCDRGLNPRKPFNEERGLFPAFDGVGGQRAAKTIKESLDCEPLSAEFVRRAHVGDSRVYRLDGGRLLPEAIDHTDPYDQARAGLISEEEATTMKTIRIGRRARPLLCADGIHRLLSEQETACALAIEDPQLAAERLKQMAHERGDPGAARQAFASALGDNPQYAHYWMGRASLELGHYLEAARSFEGAARLDPNICEAYPQAAAAYESTGDHRRAQQTIKLYGEMRTR